MKRDVKHTSEPSNSEDLPGFGTLRFGIMCRSTTFQAWQAACLKKLLDSGYAEPALLIIDQDGSSNFTWKKLTKLKFWGALWKVFSILFVNRRSRAQCPVDMSSHFRHIPSISCKTTRKGKFSRYFSDKDIIKIRNHNLDFILRFGFGIVRGEILNSARFGIWSFHHDDEQKYRGGPPCFWEIYRGDNVSGAILQRLTDRLDGGIVLRRGFFKTIKTSYTRNLDAIHFGSTDWPTQVCIDIRNGNAHYLNAPPSQTTAPILHNPSNLQLCLFSVKIAANVLKETYRHLLFYRQWGIGIVDQPIHVFLTPGARPQVQWLPVSPRTRFIADPFAIHYGDHLCILFEDFDYAIGKGCISMMQVPETPASHSEVVIEQPFHMSYPYLLRHEGEIYCIPETWMAKQVKLYKARDFPRNWEQVGILIEGVAALDSTVFQHNDRWWIFATDREDGGNFKLNVWHADKLFGPWKPHANNPVKVDIRSARPAGTPFIHNGSLYRPSQGNSDMYGRRIVINRVLRLTPTEFEEEQVSLVEPYYYSQYPDGIHTLSAAGDVTLIDGARYLFIGKSSTMLMHKVRAIFSRNGDIIS